MALPNLHFFEAPYARFVVTNLNSETVTFLDKRALRAEATHTLNAPFELSLDIPADIASTLTAAPSPAGPLYVLPGTWTGLLTVGNIDLNHRKVVHNPDGSISTERSISIGVGGSEVLIPTVVGGKIVSNAAAIAHYEATGENLGTFNNPANADAYAVALHSRQESYYASHKGGIGYIEEGVNLVYWFLRWGRTLSSSPGPWECHGAAIILETSDKGDDGNPVTTINAYDPWKLLYHAPVLDEDGDMQDPVHFRVGRASDMVKAMLTRLATFYPDFDSRIVINDAWIEPTDILDGGTEFERGTSVGEAFDQLISTGTLDIYLKPLYDPVGHPGALAEMHIYKKKGIHRPEAIFSWDRWPHSLSQLERQQDGTERANMIQYYAGLGGKPIVPRTDTASIAKYGTYFEQQAYPGNNIEKTVEKTAERELALRSHGKFDYTLDTVGERSPKVFKEYNLGDTVPVWASRRLRRSIENMPLRVMSIPMTLTGDELMRVESLTVAVDPDAA